MVGDGVLRWLQREEEERGSERSGEREKDARLRRKGDFRFLVRWWPKVVVSGDGRGREEEERSRERERPCGQERERERRRERESIKKGEKN